MTSADRPRPFHGLSAKLFGLTVAAVMLVELVVFLPSAGMFHANWMQQRLDEAGLALLAADAAPDLRVAEVVGERLLDKIGADLIAVRTAADDGPAIRRIIARDMPAMAQETIDLRVLGTIDHVAMACHRLTLGRDEVIRIIGSGDAIGGGQIEVVMRSTPLAIDLAAFAVRIAFLSLFIAAATAAAIFFALRWLFVTPMRRLTTAMTAFAGAPETPPAKLDDADRSDEIGAANRVFDGLRRDLQSSFAKKARLATMGEAVAKFNHDLRNILAEAMLSADALSLEKEPRVARHGEKTLTALDRATALCRESLRFAREGSKAPQRARFPLAAVVTEAAAHTARLAPKGEASWRIDGAPADLYADREMILRLLENLGRNAFEAGATQVVVRAEDLDPDGVAHALTIADDGPGVPEDLRDKLFKPFESSRKAGGTGLGLAVVRDVARAHDGEAVLADAAVGALFRVTLG